MKVAVDLVPIRDDGRSGGATGFALELIKGLANRQGVQIMVLCGSWNIYYLKKNLPSGIQFYEIAGEGHSKGIHFIDMFLQMLRAKMNSNAVLKRNNVDLLFCPFSAATYRERGIPTVSTILDIQHEYYPQFFEMNELEHRKKFYQNIVKCVERVACISDYTRETFCEKYKFPEERAKTIYIAIQNRFSKEDETVLDRLNIRGDEYIVYPANFWEHKNHKILLHAFAMYAHKNKNLKLVLTGNPLEQGKYYDNLLKAMNISSQVVITGYVSNEELYSILKNAKGLIYPSLFEGFGIPVVEAMYLHKVIACSNLTSLPEIGCDSIYYFDPKKPDEILNAISYLSSTDITEDMISHYDEQLQKYQTDQMVDEYLKLFDETISKKEDYVFEEEVLGIYPDGWSEPNCMIHLKYRTGGYLKMHLSLPEFVGFKQKITLTNNDNKEIFILNPGNCLDIIKKIEEDNTVISLRMSKTWSPKDLLKSDDSRTLGVMIDSLLLETAVETINLKD